MSSNVSGASPTTEPSPEMKGSETLLRNADGTTIRPLTPSQVYQRKYQRKYRQWKLEMQSLGTPVTGRGVTRLSRQRLAYEVKTRYTQNKKASLTQKEIDNNVTNSFAAPLARASPHRSYATISTSHPSMVHANRVKDFPLVLGRPHGPLRASPRRLEDQVSTRAASTVAPLWGVEESRRQWKRPLIPLPEESPQGD